MILVLGARGRLGTALCNAHADATVLAPPREVYEAWWTPSSCDTIGAWIEAQPGTIETVYLAAGIVDPKATGEAHHRINFLLPQQVIRACVPLGIQVVSFGSMLETLVRAPPTEGYAASKIALQSFVAEQAQQHDLALHMRLHTLYGGGPPAPFMFAGQMLHSLRNRTPFRMSPGTQLREYHHVDDDARAIGTLAADTSQRGVLDLNHGDAVSLAELAQCTFAAFDALPLLEIGALPAPANERPALRCRRHSLLTHIDFRNARTGLPDDLHDLLSSGPEQSIGEDK